MNNESNGSDQAKRSSWVHLQSSDDGLASEASVCISYENDQEFAQKFHQIVQSLFSPAPRKQVSVRKTKHGFVITSEQLSGGGLNDQLGNEDTLDE